MRWTAASLAVVMIAIFVVAALPTLGQSLLETHAHRQAQTAWTAVLYAGDGIDLQRPPVPVLGPPGVLPQELPMIQAAGALLIDVGLSADLAMRLLGLATFVATAWLLFLLARRLMGPMGSLIALAALLFNAHAWVYGRTSTIEYLATAGGIGFLYLATRWMDERRPIHWLGAAALGLIGILGKITTGGFLLLPALLWRSRSGRWGFQQASVWALVALAVAIGYGWSAYAEGVREEQPAAAFLSMQNQLAWFFGTPAERITIASWKVPFVALVALTGFGFVAWGPIAVARARAGSQPAFVLALLALVVVMPLTLFNLYAIHDYYWAAVAPMVAVAIGLASEWLRDHLERRWVRRVAVGLTGAWVATIVGMAPTWMIVYGTPEEEPEAMRIASFIREHSQPDDWIVLDGWGWNPVFFYYADRRGLAVPGSDDVPELGEFGSQDLSDIDFEAITADPTFGPFIECDRQANCVVKESR